MLSCLSYLPPVREKMKKIKINAHCCLGSIIFLSQLSKLSQLCGVPIMRLVIRHGGQWVDGIYKGGESRMRGVRSDLSFVGLMKLVEDVVGPGRQTTFTEQLAAQFRSGCVSNQFLASLEQMQRSGETVECVMPLSNENTTVEDNNVRLEGDTTKLEDNTAFDEGNEDLFTAGEDRFDDTSDDGLEQSQDDSSDDDCLYDSDITICNNVEGKTEPVGGAEKFSFQTITIEESTCAEDRLYKGRMFSSKAELKRALHMLVIKEKFAVRVKRSCKARYEIFHKVHTCTVDGLQEWFPTMSTKMIGELISHKIQANAVALRPKDVICEMRVQWGLECLHGKAWQVKEYAERLVFGPPKKSFQLLPSYFYILEQENPDTVIAVATDEEERFKYCFWSYEACIRGFRDVMRPMVAIDTTHLKDRFKGILFVAVCKDANECVYPVAFGIGHVEDKDSWTWFLSKLRDAVGCPENTMLIFYQHFGIKKVIQNAYLEAHHGLCCYHLKKKL
ncbi:Uncharacterized protein TCM_007662 [Theobroma cacao]|uniref:MULE transposase domain-containing protein n=1 Tax=Theobroma cacao TaxID=3641 RepID=A0A061E1W3_THECC|nr:Uncharacterized protein TCM_007662 [Theobroma cacao]